ncbi:ataxin-10-like [Ruditapes philippinarum]|uniref:ataxin-10-like n=1 Tax=Ruditapes philippinarum TaxID=129788 RepID=UPI00295BB127|nr:ataxin-10-like [Ruditapes philippinarum]
MFKMAASMKENCVENYFAEFHDCMSLKSDYNQISKLNHILTNLLRVKTADMEGVRLEGTFISDMESLVDLSQQLTEDICECVTNCYRLCRNVCALCTENQTRLHDSTRFIQLTHSLMINCLQCNRRSEGLILLLRCTVQFLANYSSGNKVNQTEIQGKFCDVFRSLLLLEDIKLREYVLMVVHIILTDIASVMAAGLGDTQWSLLHTSLQVTTESDSQNGLLVTEDCLRIPGFCEKLFSEMSIQSRILISEVLINTLQRLPEDNMVTADNVSAADNVASADNVLSSDIDTDQNFDIPAVSNIHYIAADFILQSHLISSMSTDSSNDLQVMCTVKELECLCIASAHHRLYGSLQENEQLLKTAISLLKCIEEIGKQGDNVFTNVDKMSKQREVNTDHPVYGLKRDIIRLLGNMAYKHQVNQNLIRELDGIPLILEQTNIDGKNPFITQWSVFAIHNLTEQNADNRQYIAQLKLQGVDNNQAVLKERGLKAETDGRKVVIKKDTD